MKQIQGKPWFKSKNIGLGLAVIAISILTFIQENSVSPKVTGIIGILIVALRFMTNQPIKLK